MYAVLRQALWTYLTFVRLLNPDRIGDDGWSEEGLDPSLRRLDNSDQMLVLLPKSQPGHACTRQWDFIGVSTHKEIFQLIEQD